MDVARKLVILRREIGMPLEIMDVELEGLVPGDDGVGGTDAFSGARAARRADAAGGLNGSTARVG
jgi:homoserine dehydrogenase